MTTTPEDYARIEAAGASAFSRDGATLFHLRGAGLAQIWALDLAGGEARQLTRHDERVAFLRRFPKDDRLLYGIDAGGDERQQLWVLEDGQSRPLTEAPAVIHEFGAFSPDGTTLAYAANDADEARFDVLVREVAGTTPRRLHRGQGILKPAAWRPDGGAIAVVVDRASQDQSLLLLDPAGGSVRTVPLGGEAQVQSVRWHPDGGGLAALTDAGGRDMLALCRIDPDSGAVTVLHEAPGRDVEAYAFSSDGTSLATIENDRGYGVLRVGPAGGERPVVAGFEGGVVGDLAFSVDGTRLAFTAAAPTRPAALWLLELAGAATRCLWQPEPPEVAPRDFALVEWDSFDGRPIPGWLALPAGTPPNAGWPAVIWVHGGPASQVRANFRPDMQMLLARGIAVLMPNVRGSTGYGRAAMLSDDGPLRLNSVSDLARGHGFLAAHPAIDPARIAVMGQSYGGYMVNAAITEHPELWRAAISFYGIADFATLLARTGPWRRSHRAMEYGAPPLFDRISPIRQIDRVRAPVLLLHGDRDPRVPFEESEQMEEALAERQKPVRFERFEYAGHGFIRPDHRARVYAAVAGFLDEHLR